MRNVVRYQVMTIPGKLRCEIRLSIEDRFQTIYQGTTENGNTTNLMLRPFITLTILRPSEIDENGQRIKAQWDSNDMLNMTKYNMPVFLDELKEIIKGMKIPELYTYHGDRLELNEEIAQKIRRVFRIGNTTLEFSAQVLTIQPDDTRVEGVKMKFNNEQYSVQLTLNDLMALEYELDHMDINAIALAMYTNFVYREDHPTNMNKNTFKPTVSVDILPK